MVCLRFEPSEPCALSYLTIDYAQRLVTIVGRPVEMGPTEYDRVAFVARPNRGTPEPEGAVVRPDYQLVASIECLPRSAPNLVQSTD